MKKRNFFSNLFLSPTKIVKSIIPELNELDKQMQRFLFMHNQVQAMVDLYKVIAPLYDRDGFVDEISKLKKLNSAKHTELLKSLVNIQKIVHAHGRDLYGLNRTNPGEEVTSSKMMIGGVRGLSTMSARYWIENEEALRKEWHPDYYNTWKAINGYCQIVVHNCSRGITREIEKLRENLK